MCPLELLHVVCMEETATVHVWLPSLMLAAYIALLVTMFSIDYTNTGCAK